MELSLTTYLLQLASHGKVITDASQAATYGTRIYVKGNSSETLIAVLSYLIETVNAGDNFKKISSLVTGLVGGNETVSGVVDQVLPVLKGDTDTVIASLVDLLQTIVIKPKSANRIKNKNGQLFGVVPFCILY